MIIGCDLHTRYQQIAMVGTDTGEMLECRLEHENREARAFYAALVPCRCHRPTDWHQGQRELERLLRTGSLP